jgi:hypothetical protein
MRILENEGILEERHRVHVCALSQASLAKLQDQSGGILLRRHTLS